MRPDQIRQAAWSAVTETGTHEDVALALKRRFGWRCSDRSAQARLSHMLSPRHAHQLPADALLDIIAITGRDEIALMLLRTKLRKPARRVGRQRRSAA